MFTDYGASNRIASVAFPSDEWLKATNERLRGEQIPQRQRPWLALRALALESGLPIVHGGPESERIFKYFEQYSQPGSQQIGPMFQGVHFFDATFWPQPIPVVFGTQRLSPHDSLRTMPRPLLDALVKSAAALDELIAVWCATVDYALSIDDLRSGSPGPALEFLHSASRELSTAVNVLLARAPHKSAMFAARLSLEMTGKWFLATQGVHKSELKQRYGHKLGLLLERCAAALPPESLLPWQSGIASFPPMDERYSDSEPEASTLWQQYRTTLFVSTRLLREKTGRDCRKSQIDAETSGTP